MKKIIKSFLLKILESEEGDAAIKALPNPIDSENSELVKKKKRTKKNIKEVSLKQEEFEQKELEKEDKTIDLQTSNDLEDKDSEGEIFVYKATDKKNRKKSAVSVLSSKERAARDLSDMMEVPFLALSKNRKKPIVYEKKEGNNTMHVRVSPHSEHYMASIYDWDIILFVAGKLQKTLNEGTDIPPRRIVFPRHEILKALKKHDGKKEELDLRAALSRLQATRVETNIRNEDGRYGAVFSFIDGWAYTNRKDVREIWVNLSDWLYEGICAKGSLLMVDSEYFSMTSGIKRFLYRTARKHVGIKGGSWEFLVRTLYEKSGSEQEFKFFKRDLKNAVFDNDIPGYFLEWIEREDRVFVKFNHVSYDENKLLTN